MEPILKSEVTSLDKQELLAQFPALAPYAAETPTFWANPHYGAPRDDAASLREADVFDAGTRWRRFAPYLAEVFPETAAAGGIIESPIYRLPHLENQISQDTGTAFPGKLYMKADSELPVSGSIKSRGGIYEVLKFAETIAMREGDLAYTDDYRILNSPRYKQMFSKYGIAVGSTGNLGLSIGLMASTLGFQTTVHMSADARQWKKDKLRANGVTVVEYDADFTTAITAGRKKVESEPNTYFIDDEGSTDLFLGYAVAAIRLGKQLKDAGIKLDADHPVFVYLPAGVGGSPGGVTFGLKTVLGANIHGIFAEPTHMPSVTIGMISGLQEKIDVYDLGIDGKTAADGLAVPRPSRLAGRVMDTLLLGSCTFPDDDMMRWTARLAEQEHHNVEPSGAGGLAILERSFPALAKLGYPVENATHIIWATGGSMVPAAEMADYIKTGDQLLAE
jgi:D-serine dehydratase